MKQSMNINLQSLTKILRVAVSYHYWIFILIIMSIFGYAILSITSTVNIKEDAAYKTQKESQVVSDKFDETTIDKVRKLKYRSQTDEIILPDGRINPFIE